MFGYHNGIKIDNMSTIDNVMDALVNLLKECHNVDIANEYNLEQ